MVLAEVEPCGEAGVMGKPCNHIWLDLYQSMTLLVVVLISTANRQELLRILDQGPTGDQGSPRMASATSAAGKYVFTPTLKELRFHLCQQSEGSVATK